MARDMAVRIVTDSSTNVPDEYLQRLNIIEAPAVVNFGQDSYLYKQELTLDEFYRRLATSDRLPTTAQPTPQQFLAAYQQAADEGASEVVAVCVSSKLSGTYNSAVIAAEHAPIPVHPVDALHVSLAGGWQSIAAGEMAAAGRSAADILARLDLMRQRTHMAFTPANLKYIIASGRAPRLQGIIGDLLNIKPILVTTNGELEPVARVRTQRKALEHMLELMAPAIGSRPTRIAVGHCNVPDDAAAFAVQVKERLNAREVIIFDLGMLAALGGPGLLGLTGYSLEEN